jgi:hypothetical protein
MKGYLSYICSFYFKNEQNFERSNFDVAKPKLRFSENGIRLFSISSSHYLALILDKPNTLRDAA